MSTADTPPNVPASIGLSHPLDRAPRERRCNGAKLSVTVSESRQIAFVAHCRRAQCAAPWPLPLLHGGGMLEQRHLERGASRTDGALVSALGDLFALRMLVLLLHRRNSLYSAY